MRSPGPKMACRRGCELEFSNASSNGLSKRMHRRTGCICLAFLHGVFSNVASNCLNEKMQSHTGCICLAFLHCEFSNASSNGLSNRHRLYLFDLSLLCVFKCLLISPSFENAKSHWVHLFAFSPASQCVFSNCLHQRMRSNIDCICTTSLR